MQLSYAKKMFLLHIIKPEFTKKRPDLIQIADNFLNDQNVKASMETLIQLANQKDLKDADALAFLGICFSNGIFVYKDYQKALDCFIQASELGSTLGTCTLACAYRDGEGCEPSIKGFYMLETLVYQGNVLAQCEYASWYREGTLGVSKSLDAAIFIARMAADQGSCNGRSAFAALCIDKLRDNKDKNLPKDISEQNVQLAIKMLEKSLQEGDSYAATLANDCYIELGNRERGLKILLEHANQNPDAAYMLSKYYWKATDKDRKKALEFCAESLKQGYSIATGILEEILETEMEALDAESIRVAETFQAAAKDDSIATETKEKFEIINTKRNALKVEFRQVAETFQTAVKANDPVAQFNLAFCYQIGFGVDKNIPQAMTLYEKAAKQGHPEANLLLAELLYEGRADESNLEKALFYYKAAEALDAEDIEEHTAGSKFWKEKMDELSTTIEMKKRMAEAVAVSSNNTPAMLIQFPNSSTVESERFSRTPEKSTSVEQKGSKSLP